MGLDAGENGMCGSQNCLGGKGGRDAPTEQCTRGMQGLRYPLHMNEGIK